MLSNGIVLIVDAFVLGYKVVFTVIQSAMNTYILCKGT